jgi:hypothetical protein
VRFAVIETSHALQNLKTAGIDSLFNTCAEKLKICQPLFARLFHAYILQFPGEPDYVDENEDDWLYTLLNPLVHDIESEFYRLATDEAPHPAETFLIPVVDQAKFFPSMVAMNLINAVLRSSYKIGAKRYVQWFIEDNHLKDMIPPNFVDNIYWQFLEWRKESVSVFSIRNKSNKFTFRIEASYLCFFIALENGGCVARADVRHPSDPLILTYENLIDEVKAKCGCERLSRNMFASLLFAVGNIDSERTVYVDQACKMPLDLVNSSYDNDVTSYSEDNRSEENTRCSEDLAC